MTLSERPPQSQITLNAKIILLQPKMKVNLNSQFLGNAIVVSQFSLRLESIVFGESQFPYSQPGQDPAFLMAPSW